MPDDLRFDGPDMVQSRDDFKTVLLP